jgi:hypothetical protein
MGNCKVFCVLCTYNTAMKCVCHNVLDILKWQSISLSMYNNEMKCVCLKFLGFFVRPSGRSVNRL